MRSFYLVGNWKMNHQLESIDHFFRDLNLPLKKEGLYLGIAPQALHIEKLISKSSSWDLRIGGQNCSSYSNGAYTGEISPASLKNIGCDFVIVGHSERRSLFNETHEVINKKLHKALEEGLRVIFCLGENLEEREKGETERVLAEQLENGLQGILEKHLSQLVLAYEPVWAIGTGKTATASQAQESHSFIRNFCREKLGPECDSLSILYGGSVKPENFESLLREEDIDGGLVGGASLKGEDFSALSKIAFSLA